MRIGLKEDLYLQPHAAGPLRPLRNMIRLALGKPPVQHSVLPRTPWEQWRLWQNMTPQSTAQKICHAAENNALLALTHTLDTGRFADPNRARSDGSRPIFLALEPKRSQALQALLERPDLDLNVQDANGLTPIAKAIHLGDAATMQTLLDAKRDGSYLIDPKAKVGNNPSVLEIAAALGNAAVMKVLLEHPNCSITAEERDNFDRLQRSRQRHDEVRELQALVVEDGPRDWAALAVALPRVARENRPRHNLLAELFDDTGADKEDRRAVAEELGKQYLADMDTSVRSTVAGLPRRRSMHMEQMLAAMTLASAATGKPSIEDAGNFVRELLESVKARETGREQRVAQEALRCLRDLSPNVPGHVSVLDPAQDHQHPAAAAMVAELLKVGDPHMESDAGPSRT